MPLDSLTDGQSNEQSSDGPSVSYLYLYEEGREQIENWPEEKQEVMAEAYRHVSQGGIARATFNRSAEYENIHDATAHLMVGIAKVFEDGDFSDLLEFIGPDADAVAQYLDQNPEVAEELQDRLAEAQPA